MLKSLLSEETSLKSILYYFGHIDKDKDNFIPLNTADVLDCQINWDINNNFTDGYVIFEDKLGIIDLLTHDGYAAFKIKATDFFNVETENVFSITRIEQQMDNAFSAVFRIEFIDIFYKVFSACYIGKGYNNSRFSDVFKDYTTNTSVIGRFSRSIQNIEIGNTRTVYDNIVVPVHKPFTAFITNREIIDGCLYYNTRIGSCLTSLADLKNNFVKMSDGKSGVIFTLIDKGMPEDMPDPFAVYNIKILSNDSLSNNIFTPNTLAIDFDYKTKSFSNVIIKGDIAQNVFDDSTSVINKALTSGFRNIETPNDTRDIVLRVLSITAIENLTIEIEVIGSHIYNLLNKVYIKIPSRIKLPQGNTSYNKLLSGEYTILKIVDKYTRGHFSQTLTLGRVGVNTKD